MENKSRKFWSLFKHKSFVDFFNAGGHLDDLSRALTEEEIDFLVSKNLVFIVSMSPSSRINLSGLDINGELNLISFDLGYFRELTGDEFVSIILHEIGHLFHPKLKNIDGEYAADAFAASKGNYANWIISSLEKGVKNNWKGFNKEDCELRIKKIREIKKTQNETLDS
jgi:hypothetical protein